MMRSLYSGVAGLQNHQIRMDVIGNNVANVNTTGFKKGRVNFQDMLYQMISGAAKPTEEVGGVNPKQVGLGMLVSSIDTIHTQGSIQTTGVKTDVSISGEGFFILKDADRQFYTRAGAFALDENGRLVNPTNGMRVQGWLSENVAGETIINTAADLEDIVIPVYSKDLPKATTDVTYRCNLDQRAIALPEGASPKTVIENTHTATIALFDSLGNKHELRLNFSKSPEVNNRWIVTATVDGVNARANVARAGEAAPAGANNFVLNFDNNGNIISVVDADGDTMNQGILQAAITFDVAGTEPPITQTLNLTLGTANMADGITQAADFFTTKAIKQDGHGLGYLEDFKIDQNGVITGVYSNGVDRALGQIALATFTNPGGLEKSGENNYIVSNNSGLPLVSPSGTEGKGKILSGTLEMSNVDLAEQFVDMIVTQRGFQANSRSITTSDQMLQEVLTLKR
jgi:flagellar hook protein FlgE